MPVRRTPFLLLASAAAILVGSSALAGEWNGQAHWGSGSAADRIDAPEFATLPIDNYSSSQLAPSILADTLGHSALSGDGVVASGAGNPLVDSALALVGVRYHLGGESPQTGLDCSGLVRYVFHDAAGLDLPHRALEISRMGIRVARDKLRPGDIIFFNTLRRAFSHVGIYIGDGQFVHAPATGGNVRVESLDIPYWTKRFNGARRIDG